MATSIKSTALDFNNIKNNLKTYFQGQPEFKDYNFEAAGLSNILDVLAYNTHINALVANFTINESYLNTAQLRSSVVSLAETLGYVPSSNTSAIATVRISTTSASAPINLTLPAYTEFKGQIGDTSYSFLTVKNHYAVKDNSDFFRFATAEGDLNILLYEGKYKKVTFTVGNSAQFSSFYITSDKIDTGTVSVKVYPPGSSSFVEYTNITQIPNITSESTFYIMRESPTGGYDLQFGDNNGFGVYPDIGSTIIVEFIEGTGDGRAAGIGQFTAASNLQWTTYTNGVPSVGNSPLSVTLISPSSGGLGKESIDSIRLKAPFNYATQNRAITAQDYISLINRSFGNYIQDVVAWGGQDNVDPEFGAVFVSLNFFDAVSNTTRGTVKSDIINQQTNLGVMSYKIRFVDPDITYVSFDITTYYNPVYTSSQVAGIETAVYNAAARFFTENVNANRFYQSIQTSKVLQYLDGADPGILGNSIDVLLQKRFVPSAPTLRQVLINLADLNPLTDAQLDKLIELSAYGKYKDIANNMIKRSAFSDVIHSSSNYLTIYSAITGVTGSTEQNIQFPVELADPTTAQYVIDSTPFTFNGVECRLRNITDSYDVAIVNSITGVVINKIGTYSTTGGLTIEYFAPTDLNNTFKIFARPANKALVATNRNELIQYDAESTTIRTVKTSTKG